MATLKGTQKRMRNTAVCHPDHHAGGHPDTTAATGSVPLAMVWMNAVKGKTRTLMTMALNTAVLKLMRLSANFSFALAVRPPFFSPWRNMRKGTTIYFRMNQLSTISASSISPTAIHPPQGHIATMRGPCLRTPQRYARQATITHTCQDPIHVRSFDPMVPPHPS